MKSVQFNLFGNTATSSNNKISSSTTINSNSARSNSTTLSYSHTNLERKFTGKRSRMELCKKTKTSREIRNLRMFTAILLLMSAFLICRLPTWFFLLYKLYYSATSNLSWILNYTFGLLSLFNCVLNPLLYTFLTETIQFSCRFINRVQQIFQKPYFVGRG